jgi:indole-3-glycerol phosphate synthase
MKMRPSLAQILKTKREQATCLATRPLEELREEALRTRNNATPHQFREAMLRKDRLNVIAEIKRASPWQNIVRAEMDPAEVAQACSSGGAAAISVWTEEDYFRGSLDDLRAARAAAALPVLRKDFIIEFGQVYETAIAGAEALLLITAALDEERLALLRQIAEEELGLDAFVEVQNTNEMLRAYALGATLIGVNNRDFSTLDVSLDVSVEVARAAPEDVLLVSEYGLRTGKHLCGLHALGFKGFLIGEALMNRDGPDKTLKELLRARES